MGVACPDRYPDNPNSVEYVHTLSPGWKAHDDEEPERNGEWEKEAWREVLWHAGGGERLLVLAAGACGVSCVAVVSMFF